MPRWLFAVLVLAVLQVLLWVFARSLRFMLGGKRRRWLTAAVFVAGDGLTLAALSRLVPGLFIAQAWLIALLWLWFLAAAAGFVLYVPGKRFAPQQAATALRVFLPAAFAALFAWGFFNANSTVVRHYAVALDKPMAQPLRIGVATDLHLDSGFFFGARELDRLAAIFAEAQVDVILLPGDVINDRPDAFYAENGGAFARVAGAAWRLRHPRQSRVLRRCGRKRAGVAQRRGAGAARCGGGGRRPRCHRRAR